MAARLKKKPAWNGRSFKSLFNKPPSQTDTVKIQVNSSQSKCVKETLVKNGSKQDKVQTSNLEVSDSNRESRDVGSKCGGDTATLLKRKRDLCTDLHASSQPETSDEFETCVTCSKRQRLCNGKYCKTSCHSSSLDPCTGDVLVGVWQCFQCLNSKIAYEGKSSPSKFVEFWVPSIISNVQLEQYCDTLLSNSISLRSYSRTDPVGALRDIVFSTRKSCDHPYIVNPSLKHLITKDLPPVSFLDAEIKASGKLQLLEMILSEIKKRQLRVLILFQSVAGSGRDTPGLGDILDDFLRERFGADTYERVDGGAFPSKSRQTALSNFNEGNGRFAFLLENRACLPSIKLVSVDTIIIYDSDWNPAHDVKALNKISIDSKSKKIKIFRLYSAFTVEEKVLILAKQGLTLESNLESISRATSNTLLMWGASYLLDRLNEFHSTPDKSVSSEQELSSKVVDEISTLLSQNGECDNVDNFCILKIQQRGRIYSSSLKLLGEQQIQLSDDGHARDFWTNLLNKRILKWKFLSGRTQRHRKTVQYSDYIPKNAECGTLKAGKKRKNGETKINPTILNPELERDKTGGASGIRGDYGFCCSKLLHPSKVPTIVSEKSTLPNAKTNFDLVKTDLLKLCAILNFSDEVKIMAERLLDYVVSEHHVKSGSERISHAFLIALCWGSASLLKQKINRTDSLLLAKKHLNFSCSEIEAESVYISAVRKLKKTFEENMLSDLSDSSISGVKKSREGKLTENMSQLQNVKPELEEIRDQIHTGDISQGDETHEVETENNFDLIHRKCKKRIEKLKQKQEEEIRNMNEYWEVQRAEIESKQKVESIVYAEVFRQSFITDKLKVSDNKWRMRLEELERQKEKSLEELKAKHLDALSNERSKAAQWLKSASLASFAAKVAGQDELALHLSGIQNGESKILFSNVFEDDNQDVKCNDLDVITENPGGLENALSVSLHHSGNQNPDKTMSSGSGGMILPETPERILEEVTDQIVEVNPLDEDQEGHLAENHPESLQEMVEDAEELPSQVLHIGSNVELLPPTDVMENPVQQNQPDLMSTSTFDQQPLIENTSLPNSEAVPRIIGRTTELPRQPVIPAGVDMSVVHGFQDLPLRAVHQAPSQILKLTSCSDPLQNELERIHKENEQAIKLQEDAKMRLRLEFEELMAQLHRKYEDKCKDLDVVLQLKKDELDKKQSKVLMSKMLADAFRSKCVEPSRFNGMQKGVNHGLAQPLNQVPMSAASRSSAITSSSAGQPAGSQQNTVSISQPSSSVQPNVTPTTCQPAATPQNTVLLPQHGTRLLPVIASSSGSQPAVKQQCTTLLMQLEPGVQPAAASQQSAPPLQIVQQSAALFSSTPTRHPQINPITPSMGNLRIGSENRARAPAPQLQAFRSASSINLVSTLVMPSHLTQNSPSMSSHPLLHGPTCPSPSKPPN